jgi:soluble lytic murein transglycosylase
MKNSSIFIITLLVGCCVLGRTSAAWAGLYSYVDEKGRIYLTDRPDNPKYKLVVETQVKEDNFDFFIAKFAKKYKIDPLLIKAVIKVESDFEVGALSGKGAQGLMQLMPQTARHLAVEDVWNPHHNIEGGVKYLRKMLDKFDDKLPLALAAYNAGPNNVKRYGGIPPYPETQRFVQRVIKYYRYYKIEKDAIYVYEDNDGNRYYTNIPKGEGYRRIY